MLEDVGNRILLHVLHDSVPAFTFVSNAPSIDSTHQRLPNVVKAVEHMIFGWLQQDVVDLLRVVLPYQSLKGECMCAYVPETMQLVEDGNIVDFAGFRWLSRFQVPLLTSVVGQEDEAVTLRCECSPGFVALRV